LSDSETSAGPIQGTSALLGPRARHWFARGVWAVLDQGLFAASNFGLTIALARLLGPQDFGSFAAASSLHALTISLHAASIVEPMVVFSAGHLERRAFTQYLAKHTRRHWKFAIAAAMILALVGLVLRVLDNPLSGPLLAFGLAEPLLLFQGLLRRACYVIDTPRLAALATGQYAVLVVVGALFLNQLGLLSAAVVPLIIAGASIGPAYILAKRLGLIPLKGTSSKGPLHNGLDSYSRWSTASAMLTWFPGNAPTLILPIWWGLESAASFRALLNLFLPIMQFNTAIGGLVLPHLVRAGNRYSRKQAVARLAIGLGIGPLAYWAVVSLIREPALRLAYGETYLDVARLVPMMGLVPIVAAVTSAFANSHKAMQRPELVFGGYLASSLVALFWGALLIYRLGVGGAVTGWLVAYLVAAIVMAFRLGRS